jgi:hypothetical protein
VAATKILTLSSPVPQTYQVDFSLPDIVDIDGVPKVRRGNYFIHVESETDPTKTTDSVDFRIALVSAARLKADYLHGTDQFANDIAAVLEQPKLITGVTVEGRSRAHAQSWFPLSYNFSIPVLPTITTGTQPFALSNGMTLMLRVDGGDPLTATFTTGQFVAIGAATAAEVAAAITTANLPGITATPNAGKVEISGGQLSIYNDPTGTSTTALSLHGVFNLSTPVRLLSWAGGPSVAVEPGKKTYTLRKGTDSAYITVRVKSISLLPTESHAEDLLIHRKALDVTRIQQIIDEAISWVEDSALAVFVEPTRIVTEDGPRFHLLPGGHRLPAARERRLGRGRRCTDVHDA